MAGCRNDVKPEQTYSAINAVPTQNVEGKTLEDAANYVGIICGRIATAVLKEHRSSYSRTTDDGESRAGATMLQHVTSAMQNAREDVSPTVKTSLFNRNGNENQIFINTTAINKEADGCSPAMYSEECLKGLGRSEKLVGTDFTASIVREDIVVPLPSDFHSIEILDKKHSRRCLGGNYANFFSKLLFKHNPYCCWAFKYNRVKGKRCKRPVPFFQGMAKCTIEGCGSTVYIKVRNSNSDTVHLSFKGDIHHPKGVQGARRITLDEKERLKNYFVSNRNEPPSNKLREELANVDHQSYAAGNLTGAGKTKTAFEKLAFKARKEASSIEVLRDKIMQLQKQLAATDEEESIIAGHVFRHEFGYMHKANFSQNNIEIILLDEPMATLYHEHVRNDILYIDATGRVTENVKGCNRILYYVAAIRHPFGKSPPIPIAEYITTSHDQYSIRQFLMAIHEKEYRRNKANIANPWLVMTDYSWAILLACMKEFCYSSLEEYLNRTFRIIIDKANKEDLEKTIIHICLAHVMNMNRRECMKIFKNDRECGSKIHFCMRFLACLVNSQDVGEAVGLVRNAYFLMTSENANENARIALCNIERKVNNLNLEWDLESECESTNDYLNATMDVNGLRQEMNPSSKSAEEFVSRKEELEVQNSYNSLLHRF